MEDKFAAQGLHVLGFLSNDFGNQGGTDEEVEACAEQYKVTFLQFAMDHVIDPDGDGPAEFVCDPPAEPGSLYENEADSYDINDIDAVSMCKYRGKVLLVVNTAAV